MPDPVSRREILQALGAGTFLFAGAPLRIHSADDGTFTVYTGKVELGQGARTELTQAVAEELRVPIDHIHLVMGDTALCPDDGGTFSSFTTPFTIPAIRQAAADTRGGQLTPPSDWKVLGTPVANLRGRDIVTGAHQYPTDLHVDDMLHARVIRAPYYRASLVSLDGPAVRDGDLIAAVAPDPVSAARLAAKIKTQWKPEPFPVDPSDHAALAAWFKANSTPPKEPSRSAKYPPSHSPRRCGQSLASTADHKRSFQFWLPYIAHTPMEPRAAVAIWKDGAVEIRTGTQTPFPVRAEVAKALDLPESKVHIIAINPGGGFGGKHKAECEIEAARLARIAGKPVKVAWTREEEFTCSYLRPAGWVEIEELAWPQRQTRRVGASQL